MPFFFLKGFSVGNYFASSVKVSTMFVFSLADTSRYCKPTDRAYSSATSFFTSRLSSRSTLLPTSVIIMFAGAFSFNSSTHFFAVSSESYWVMSNTTNAAIAFLSNKLVLREYLLVVHLG